MGFWRFSEGVKHARAAGDFFPKIGFIQKFIPEHGEQKKELGGTLADYDCKLCEGTGFEMGTTEFGSPLAIRCQCWIRNRQAGMLPRHTHKIEMADLHSYARAGAQFFCLADVLKEFCRRVERHEIPCSDARGAAALIGWANKFRGSEEEYAKKMLAQSDTENAEDRRLA